MIYLNDLKERLEKENIYHSYIDKERKMNKIIKFQEFKEINEFDIYLNRFEKIESFLKEKDISFIYDENKLKFLNYEIFYQNENIYLIQKLENEEIQILELNYIIFENENILNEENIIIQILKLFI